MESRLFSVARWICLAIGLTGLAMFAYAYYLLSASPETFRAMAEDFAIEKVEDRWGEYLPTPDENGGNIQSQLTGAAENFLQSRIESAQAFLDEGRPSIIAAIIHESGVTFCGCQQVARETIETFLTLAAEGTRARMTELKANVVAEYEKIQERLIADFTIFVVTNFAAFLIITLLAIFRGVASHYLLPFAAVLFIAVLITAYWYLFGQNWFFTIIFNDYWGYAYLITMVVVLGFLLDIAFNRCRVSSMILTTLTSISPTPC